MKIYRTPRLFVKLFPSITWSFFSKQPTIYLTFDDGPTAELTEAILDILDTYEAKATFFCVGENAVRFPELMTSIQEKGHAIGNHTMRHLNGLRESTEKYINDVNEANAILNTKLFRPPYGKMKRTQYNQLKKHYQIIMWSFLTYDFNPDINMVDVFQKYTSQFRSGDIIVLHDNLKSKEKITTLLPMILDWGTKKGIVFSAIQ